MNLFLVRSDKAKARLAELDQELTNLQAVLADCEAALAEKNAQRDAIQDTVSELDSKISGARDGLMECARQVAEAQNALTSVESRRQARQETR